VRHTVLSIESIMGSDWSAHSAVIGAAAGWPPSSTRSRVCRSRPFHRERKIGFPALAMPEQFLVPDSSDALEGVRSL